MQWPSGRWGEHAFAGCWRLILGCLVAGGLLAVHGRQSRATGSGWQVAGSSTPGPGPRGQYGMAADGTGHIYLYGGNAGQDAALDDFWEYDTATDSWQPLANGVVPPLIEAHLAIDAQGQVWEFGGIAGPGAPHLTADGHSYGLYKYQPSLGAWRDLTPSDALPGEDWPEGREDHGFAFDSQANNLVVFAGESQDDVVLNDMWTYSEQAGSWTRVSQQYAGSGGAAIAPREIYNVSADTHGHLYLFGGSYLTPPDGAGENAYANDLWRYDDATQTWSLLGGIPNGYDPTMPLPRHYYGQTVDAAGDFDILCGYLDAPEAPPFFGQDSYASYALPFQFAAGPVPGTYGLSDFWQFDPSSGWHDRSASLGALAGAPAIPYAMVFDPLTNRLYTFGGLHPGQDGLLEPSAALWSLDEDDPAVPSPTAAVTATTSPTATATWSATPAPSTTATEAAVAFPSVTPTVPTTTIAPRAPLSGTIVTKTLLTGPYKLTLDIGPLEQLYSEAQVQQRHPRAGAVVLGGTIPLSATRTQGSMPNHQVDLHISSSATGKTISNVPVAITITTPAGKVLQRVPIALLQRIAKGPVDRYFGNDVWLPAGHYRVVVQVRQASVTFGVLLTS